MNAEKAKLLYQNFLEITQLNPASAVVILGSSLLFRGWKKSTHKLAIAVDFPTWRSLQGHINSNELEGSIHFYRNLTPKHIKLDMGIVVIPEIVRCDEIIDGVAVQSLKALQDMLISRNRRKEEADLTLVGYLLVEPPLIVPRVHAALSTMFHTVFKGEDYVHPRKLGFTAVDLGLVWAEDVSAGQRSRERLSREESLDLLKFLIGSHYNAAHKDIDEITGDAIREFVRGAYFALNATRFETLLA